MKKTSIPIGLMFCALTLPTHAAEEATPSTASTGAIDFGEFKAPENGQFVEISINSNLINMAARLVEKEEPEAAKVLGGLKSIRINVIGLNDDNRADLKERMNTIRTQLTQKGWDRLVTVQEKNQDVGIFTKVRGKEAVEGITVTVIDGDKEAVFINVVGDIRPEQLADVADRLNLEPLKRISMAMDGKH